MKKKPNLLKNNRETRTMFLSSTFKILDCANQGKPRQEFLKEVLLHILRVTFCDLVVIKLGKIDDHEGCKARTAKKGEFHFEAIPTSPEKSSPLATEIQETLPIVKPCQPAVSVNSEDFFLPTHTCVGIADGDGFLCEEPTMDRWIWFDKSHLEIDNKSIGVFPIKFNGIVGGVLEIGSAAPRYFIAEKVKLIEELTALLGIALTNWHHRAALQERVKELACLYHLSSLLYPPDKPLQSIMQEVVEVIPQAWLYPEVAFAKTIFDGQEFFTTGFKQGPQKQVTDIVVNGERRGEIMVTYAEEKPVIDEGPFMKEERKLLDNIARQLSLLVERRLYEEEKIKITDQLRHADRLAMMGQISAAVAHELNEPLTSVLGFAQLAGKTSNLPEQTTNDINKIVSTALHAREIVRKLLMYSRKMPAKKGKIALNELLKETVGLFELRYAKEGIEFKYLLLPELGYVCGDPGQLRQVIINIVLNAIQAMPNGGQLSLETKQNEAWIFLVVSDTGVGMNSDVMGKIFIPFFTTKGVRQGTGLGLSVAHGIVSEMQGDIDVQSWVGQGTRISISLPRLLKDEAVWGAKVQS